MFLLTDSLPEFAKAKIVFDPEWTASRKNPFTVDQFRTVARFDEDHDPDSWTMVLYRLEDEDNVWKVCWLVPSAPQRFLRQLDAKFSVYEGPRLMARGEIIEASNGSTQADVGGC